MTWQTHGIHPQQPGSKVLFRVMFLFVVSLWSANDMLFLSLGLAAKHVWESELHRAVTDDRLVRIVSRHVPWSQGIYLYVNKD